MTSPPADELRRPSLARAGTLLGPAMALANLLQYVLQLVASHNLAPEAFGAFGSLLGLGLVGAVAMLALQNVAARHVALRRDDAVARRAEVARLLRTSLRLAVVITVASLPLAPVVAAFLHVPVVAVVWLALSLGPLAVAGAAQGVLQGRERFGLLAGLFVIVSGLRVVGGVVGLLLVRDVTWGVAGTAVGAIAGSLVALVLVRGERAPEQGSEPSGFSHELTSAANGVLALLALAGADLLLARHVLSGAESGRYAAGSLVARGCFWLPQFVAVLVVPRLASGDTTLVRRAVTLVAGLGLLEIVGTGLIPGSVLGLLLGDHYRSLAHTLALFAAEGGCLAVLQLLLYSDIARGESTVGRLLWAAVALEAALVLAFRPGLAGVVVIALVCTAAALLAALMSASRLAPVHDTP